MLDKDGSVPLYLQLKNLLVKQVEEGLYQEGKAIPSERELCQSYGVSRITVRQAIGQAISEGLLYRRQGKGTFVTKMKIDQSLERITGFEGTIAARGLMPATSLVDVSHMPANEEIASALGIEKGAPTVRMILLGLAGSEPMALYTSYFVPDLGWAMGEKAVELTRQGRPFTSFDLYRLLDGVKPARAKQTFEASLATGKVARLLRTKEPTPVFVVTSLVTCEDGIPWNTGSSTTWGAGTSSLWCARLAIGNPRLRTTLRLGRRCAWDDAALGTTLRLGQSCIEKGVEKGIEHPAGVRRPIALHIRKGSQR